MLAGTPGVKGCADGAVGVARFGWIHALALDSQNSTLYAADTVCFSLSLLCCDTCRLSSHASSRCWLQINHRILSVSLVTGVVTTILGAASPSSPAGAGAGAAANGEVALKAPSGLAFDSVQKRLLIADTEYVWRLLRWGRCDVVWRAFH